MTAKREATTGKNRFQTLGILLVQIAIARASERTEKEAFHGSKGGKLQLLNSQTYD
ncbi:MAG: hypothetical protein RMM53_09115 [Bacteroidia bacterium]|nr:hypothetical protein [Bacteroidia bacterium]